MEVTVDNLKKSRKRIEKARKIVAKQQAFLQETYEEYSVSGLHVVVENLASVVRSLDTALVDLGEL